MNASHREPRLAAISGSVRRRWAALLLVVLLAGAGAACLREAWLDALTFDEPIYVAAGVIGLDHQVVAYNDEHPPLPKLIAALPVLAAKPAVPWGWHYDRSEWHYASVFVRAQLTAGKLRLVTFLARLIPIAELLAVAVLLYRLGVMLHGPPAGLTAAALWLAEPVTLGIGHLDGVDLPLALTTVLISLALLRWLRRRDRVSLMLTGLAAGAAVAAAPTGLLPVAVAAGTVTVAGWRDGRGQAAVNGAAILAMAFVLFWASYAAIDPHIVHRQSYLLPMPFLRGLRFLAENDASGPSAYLLGEQWNGHEWWFWPGSLLVKIPLPALLVLMAGPIGWRFAPRQARREAFAVVLLPMAALAAFDVPELPDTGLRYLLPVLALWAVAASAAARLARRAAGRAALAAAVAAAAGLAAFSFPHSIAWTSVPLTPGYQLASGSSLDWGQDFNLLYQWTGSHRAHAMYYGSRALQQLLLTRAAPLTSPGISGWVAVSATRLDTDTRLWWLHDFCPVGTIGGSIVVYRFRRPAPSLPAPDLPAGPCQGRYSERVTTGTELSAPATGS